ncbi:MAG: putative toxin-antitoxin system toxin component, PIN family [Verrucomicrobia bacterium]|nr:putative toxin-antitoxin system toxin component, PIN family [Verrucomicrobiota bacterium]
MRVVFDANVVAAGVCWNGEGSVCLAKLARRQVFAWGSTVTLEETRETVTRLIQELRPAHNAAVRLNWYMEKVRVVEPAPLGKQSSRDAQDDPYLACALAAGARVIVSYDKDLLALEKPFGIQIVRPAMLFKLLQP